MISKKCLALLAGFLLTVVAVSPQEINIIPQPVSVIPGTGNFILSPSTRIYAKEKSLQQSITFFNSYLQRSFGFSLKKTENPQQTNIIYIGSEYLTHTNDGPVNSYYLQVEKNKITINSLDSPGFFYAMQTLIQLLPLPEPGNQQPAAQLKIPQLTISDHPRFAYRGMHFDVSRHFFPVEYVKRYIDYIALHKMNYFHWHLTDDQGWRIEIKKYPKLTSVGAWRNGTITGRYPGNGNDGKRYGGYYTQEQIKEVVKYAADRYITVIPEIEMPGHSSAAIAAYPELSCFPDEPTIKYYPKECKWNGDSSGKQVEQTWGIFDDVYCAGKENTFAFTENVLDEVMALFPSTYIHIGGDECPKSNWKRCPDCQQRMKDNHLKDEHELQSYFIQRVEKYLNSKGRKIIGWDEILEGGLAPNATVMSWRGEQGGIEAAKQNHDVIMTPGNPVYFDHTQSQNEDSVTIGGYNPIEKVYAYEPVPKQLNDDQSKHILGAQANLWTEYISNKRKVEYMLFPRLSALSEVLWSPEENRNWDDFQKRLKEQFGRYELWRTNYSKAFFDLKATILPTDSLNAVLWKLETKQPGTEIKYIEHYAGRPYELTFAEGTSYSAPVKIRSTELIAAISMVNGKPVSNPVYETFHFNKATAKKITLTNLFSDKYPGDGAFTLVNGVINEKGFARSNEFLGFSGTDCEAVIDLGESQPVSFVVVNALNRKSSWIWRPAKAEVFGSGDGKTWYSLKSTDIFDESDGGTGKGKMTLSFKATYAQYIKVVIRNWGIIPAGNPGAGNKAWLFVDEIEVE